MTVRIETLLTGEQLVERCPWLSQRLLYHWLSSNASHFRKRCTVKIGRIILFDVPAIEVWMEEHRGVVASDSNAPEATTAEAL